MAYPPQPPPQQPQPQQPTQQQTTQHVPSPTPPPNLKQRLLAGETMYGTLVCTASPVVSEIVSLCGYDLVVIDGSHSSADTGVQVQMLQSIGASGSAGIIKIPENSPLHIKKALDAGPAGIIIPTIDSAEAAKRAVASCKYPPYGIRSYSAPTVRASMYGLQKDYLRRVDDLPLIIAQVESDLAVGRIPEIAAVDGIDCIMVSPDDLAMSIGKAPEHEHEEVHRLIRRAEDSVLGSGKLLGSFMPHGGHAYVLVQEMYMRGYSIVIGSNDVALLRDAARLDMTRAKGAAARPPGTALSALTVEGKNPVPGPLLVSRMPPMGPGAPGPLGVGPVMHAGVPGGLLHLPHHMSPGHPHGMHYTMSRRGGRGTPKRCSSCHMPLKEGHKADCAVWERKVKMKRLTDGEETGSDTRETDTGTQLGTETPNASQIIPTLPPQSAPINGDEGSMVVPVVPAVPAVETVSLSKSEENVDALADDS